MTHTDTLDLWPGPELCWFFCDYLADDAHLRALAAGTVGLADVRREYAETQQQETHKEIDDGTD